MNGAREYIKWSAFFLLLSCLVNYRLFLEGYFFTGGDAYLYNFPMRWYYSQLLQSGGFSLWNPYTFAGLPFIGTMQAGPLYPLNTVVFGVIPFPWAFLVSQVLHYAMGGFFLFLLLREMRLSPLASVAGGVVFMALGFMGGSQIHTSIMNAAAWMPLAVLLVRRLWLAPSIRVAVVLSLALGLQMLAGNMQICLYTWMASAMVVLFMATSSVPVNASARWRRKYFTYLVASFAGGLLLAMPQLYGTIKLGAISVRTQQLPTLGYLFFSEFSVRLSSLPSLFMPGLFFPAGLGENVSMPVDSMVIYLGILPVSIAAVTVMGMARQRRDVALWAVLAFMGLALCTATDTGLGRALFHLPAYNKFRAHGRIILELSLAVSVLFAIGLDSLIHRSWRGQSRGLFLFLIVAMISATLAVRLYWPLVSLSNAAVISGLLFMFAYAALALWHHWGGQGARPLYLMLGLLVLEIFILGRAFHMDAYGPAKVDSLCRDNGYERLRQLDEGQVRVARLSASTVDMYNVPCRVGSINSYEVLMPLALGRFMDMEFLGMSRYWPERVVENSVLSLLNVRYLISPKGSPLDIDAILTGVALPVMQKLGGGDRPVNLPLEGDRHRNLLTLKAPLPPGAYIINYRARAIDGQASLRVEAYFEGQENMRFRYSPLTPLPGMVKAEAGQYHRLFLNDSNGPVSLSLISTLSEPLEVNSLEVLRAEGYGPLPMRGPAYENTPVYRKAFETAESIVYENTNALGVAYPVTRIVQATGLWELKRLFEVQRLDPSQSAVMYASDAAALRGRTFSPGLVSLKSYDAGDVRLKARFPDNGGNGFVVLSEQHYPGWRATVDGSPVDIHRVNGVLQGVVVPAGEHEVRFLYRPVDVIAMIWTSFALFIGAVAWTGRDIYRAGRA